MKVKFYLKTGGIKLNKPIAKIMKLREDEVFCVWQMETFDELVSLNVDICKLLDEDIELIFEVESTEKLLCCGSMNIFNGNVLKSALNPLILTRTPVNSQIFDEIVKLEKALYTRKSKQVANWQIHLMKSKLKKLKEELFEANSEAFVINLIIPIPSHPLKLRSTLITADKRIDLCMQDIEESQEENAIKRKYPELFKGAKNISNGDLRALRGILQRSEGIPVDAANLLWTHREYLSRKFPVGVVQFVESVQWWLAESDPTEIDEALRVIDNWRFVEENKMEIAVLLMVSMCKLNGLDDNAVWMRLFKRLIIDEMLFCRRYQSALIHFLRSKETEKMGELRGFFKSVLFNEKDVSKASELYWRLKTLDASGDSLLFKEYKENLTEALSSEIGKQEKLFEVIEEVLSTAQQKIKGPRTMKLEFIKQTLNDPESGIPSATQQHPLIPGLKGDGRVAAIVSDRSNLFKSTAFTVLLVFLRLNQEQEQLSLPIIFKKGDDLRRDAACLRVFRAIWDIWMEEGGLQLFPRELLYGVTALKEDFGIVEFVESVPLSRIINVEDDKSEWSIAKYLSNLSDKNATRNFLSSCVGFSLLTYLLGIGDRHLDNLLLTPQGQLLHIDFSFVFGDDPKPFPPPIKITREMVRGFEAADENGEGNEKWNEFKGLCFTALTLLRRKSALILSLIECEYPSTPQNLIFVRERLGVLSSQAESLQKVDRLMEESRGAMFPVVMETIHKWVQYWKS